MVQVQDSKNEIVVEFTPTIPHCSMATLIGLCIRVKLLRALPSRFKVCYIFFVGFNCFGLFYLLLSFLAPAECGRLQ